MRWLWAWGTALILAGSSAGALAEAEYTGKLTKPAQIFEAPGPYPSERGTLAAGTPVEAEVCFAEGAYCLVKAGGVSAFVEGGLIAVPVDEGTATALELEQRKWERIRKEAALPRQNAWERRNLVVWGDSLSTNTFGDELEDLLLGRSVSMQGVPGEDGKQISARMLGDTRFDGRIKVIWDRHWGGESIEQYMAELAPMTEKAAASGLPFVIVSDVPRLTDEGTITAAQDAKDVAAFNKALKARYPEQYFDLVEALAAPRTRQADGLHLSKDGEAAVAAALADYVNAKGW